MGVELKQNPRPALRIGSIESPDPTNQPGRTPTFRRLRCERTIAGTRTLRLVATDWHLVCAISGVAELDLDGATIRLSRGEVALFSHQSSMLLRSCEGIRPDVLVISASAARSLRVGCHLRALGFEAGAFSSADPSALNAPANAIATMEQIECSVESATCRLPGSYLQAWNLYHRLSEAKNAVSICLSISVGELAQKACFSKGHFNRCFKSSFGMSPRQHIIGSRLRRAIALMECGQVSTVEKIAESCGYQDRRSFSRAFKTMTGKTPTEYWIELLKPDVGTNRQRMFR